jgi:hypothetical protein
MSQSIIIDEEGESKRVYPKDLFDMYIMNQYTGMGSGGAFTAEYSAYLSKLSSLGITAPDSQIQTIQNQLIIDLKNAGFLSRGMRLHVYGFGSIGAGTVNIANPNTYLHTVVGSVTFTESEGVKSGAAISGGYIRTGGFVNEFTGIESNFTAIVYVSDDSTDVAVSMYVYGARGNASSSTTGQAIKPLSTGSAGTRIGYNVSDSFSSVTHKGLYVHTQNSTQSIMYKDGVKDVAARTPVAPDISDEILFLTRNTDAAGGRTSSESYPHYAMMLAEMPGSFSDADELSFRTIWNTFVNSLPVLITMASTVITMDSTIITMSDLYA